MVVLVLATCVFIVALPVLQFLRGGYTASDIKDGETPEVTVQYRSYSSAAGQVTERELRLIGSAQKAMFFYDGNDNRALVIPQAQVVSIEVPQNSS